MIGTKFSKEILKKQLIGKLFILNLELSKNSDGGFSVGLIDDNDFFKWSVCFTGPEETIYEVKLI